MASRFTGTFAVSRGWLKPVDAVAEELVGKIKEGREALVTVATPRNPKHHRQYFALLQIVLDQFPEPPYPHTDAFRKALLLALGEADPIVDLNGEVHFQARSMAVESMPKDEFDDFYDRTVQKIAETYYPRFALWQIREIERVIAGNSPPMMGERIIR